MTRNAALPSLFILSLCSFSGAGNSQEPSPASREPLVPKIHELSKQLRWNDAESRKHYEAVKDEATGQVMLAIDQFVIKNFKAEANPGAVKDAVNGLLVDFQKPDNGNVAFWANLPTGEFLVVGVDLLRLTGAVMDDAITFRAYKETGGALTALTATGGDLDGLEIRSVIVLPPAGMPSECRFVVLAGNPSSGSPFSLEARLYAFDGNKFRTLWTTERFSTYEISFALRKTATGFSIQRYDKGDYIHWRLMQDDYIQTPEGVEKSGSVEVEPQDR